MGEVAVAATLLSAVECLMQLSCHVCAGVAEVGIAVWSGSCL